jgi:hypothetical protein
VRRARALRMAGVLWVLASVSWSASRAPEAERLAAAALARVDAEPDAALADARRALALTEEFDPTDYVAAGRKGEVVEDAYQAAREAYRRHRSGLYEAVGAALFAKGETVPARRYLSRAVLLDPTRPRVQRLARALIAEQRGRETLDLLHRHFAASEYGAESIPLVERAADLVGLPSAQAELDRARLLALPGSSAEPREGLLRFPPTTRLSTGGPLRLDETITVFYLAARGCRSCSADVEALAKTVKPPVRVVLVPEDPEQDQSLRQVASLYRVAWPVLVGPGLAAALDVPPGSVRVAARQGYMGAAVGSPFAAKLPPVLAVLSRTDVRETVPRAGFMPGRAPVPARPAPPSLLPEGLAFGEDEPAPAPFVAALDAFRGGRALEALRFLDAVAAKDDGWLLPPEARLDRALCLAALGRAEEARRLLLRIGDGRSQEAVDRALESKASGRRRPASKP